MTGFVSEDNRARLGRYRKDEALEEAVPAS